METKFISLLAILALSYIISTTYSGYIGVGLFVGYLSIILNVWEILRERMMYHWSRFRQLNNLVSYRYKAPLYILLGSLQLIIKMLYLSIINYLDTRHEKVDKNTVKINITHNGKLISFFINDKISGPDDVYLIVDENYNEVTDELIPYFRLRKLLINLTPKILGYSSLEIHTNDKADPYQFQGNEIINI